MKLIPSLKQTVGFLYKYENEQYIPIGTCFFAWFSEDERVFVYLITCRHVVKDEMSKDGKLIHPLYVRLNRNDIHDVAYILLENEWVFHKDKAVDVAVTRFHPPADCDIDVISLEDTFATERIVEIFRTFGFQVSEGDRVAFIGLFHKVRGKHRNFPIYRFGHVAMIMDELLEGDDGESEYILVECEAWYGNSGSPLWVEFPYLDQFKTEGQPNYHGLVYVLGVMTDIYIDDEIKSRKSGKIVSQNTRISLVVPIRYVIDVLKGEYLMKKRKAEISSSKSEDDKPTPISLQSAQADERYFTRSDFMDALKKAVRPNPEPDQPDEGKSETSE